MPCAISGSRCALLSGFSVHAGLSIRAEDRKGLERLCRYVARPPIAADRLTELPDGRLSLQMKTPWRSGTTHVIFGRLEFMARLAALVPAPRANLIHYYGQLAPAAKWRALIVPALRKTIPRQNAAAVKRTRQRRRALLEIIPGPADGWRFNRRFEMYSLQGKVRILAAIHPTINTRKILECLESPSRAPPNARASSECTF